MKVLVLNAGSSSNKCCLYKLDKCQLPSTPPPPEWEAQIDWSIDTIGGVMLVKANDTVLKVRLESHQRKHAIPLLLNTLITDKTQVLQQLSEIDIVGHRVVHGGSEYTRPTPINTEVKQAIDRLSHLAPAHNPANLAGIEAIEQQLSHTPQVAVFDTAFHSSISSEVAFYPIPYEWSEKGIRRYGFHGISHQYCAHRAAELLDEPLASLRLVTCHLGNGCSLAAVCNGNSIDTTMGFTPLEGLMMGTRSGSIDPAIAIHLIQNFGYDANQLKTLLNQESGLKGISGISADMRIIQQAIAQGNDRAQLAIDMFIHRLRSAIGAMVASLGGLDVLVFTAGIGENSAIIRELACGGFDYLGLQIDAEANNSSPVDRDIATKNSTVRVMVVKTEEDWAIAKACWYELNSDRHKPSVT